LSSEIEGVRNMELRKCLSCKIICLMLLILRTHLAKSAAINPANAPSIFQSGGAPNFTDFNAILSANHSLEAVNDHLHYADDKPWLASYKPSDCAWALSGLQDKAAQFGDEAFSWPAIAARGKSKYKAVNTPIRYK